MDYLMELQYRDHFPIELLNLDATELHGQLGGPTVFELAGRRDDALFVSVLMHGNESTGWEAAKAVLGKYIGADKPELPRALTLFVANTEAAQSGARHLPGRPDFNRSWPGGDGPESMESRMLQSLVERMADRELFAAIDVHNNTGLNPHYSCVHSLDHKNMHLASMFNRTVVLVHTPHGLASMAMNTLCPAVTLECGKVGLAHGTEHAAEFIDACLHMSELPTHPVAHHDIDLFHTVATVKIPPTVSFGFDDAGCSVDLDSAIDHLNFRELAIGTQFGRIHGGGDIPLDVISEAGDNVCERFFMLEKGYLKNKVSVMPSMLTLDTTVIRQDCLCYLMERYPLTD